MWQFLHVVHDGGSRGGKSRHGLEVCIGEICNIAANHIGQHAKHGEDNPRTGYYEVGVAAAHVTAGIASAVEEEHAARQGQYHRHQESDAVVFAVSIGHDDTPQHQETLQTEQLSDNL